MTDIPARIMEEAKEVAKTVVDALRARDVGDLLRASDEFAVPAVASALYTALLAAEQRARKEALEEAETVDQEAFAVFIRKWVKDRFGPWITYNTAKGAYSKFCEERAAIRALANEKEG